MAAPSVFRAGVEESVSVTIFNAKAETRVQVQLSVKGQTVSHSHGSVFGENQRSDFGVSGSDTLPADIGKHQLIACLLVVRFCRQRRHQADGESASFFFFFFAVVVVIVLVVQS